jgi:hypothetical protein
MHIERFVKARLDLVAKCPILQGQFDSMLAAPGMCEVSALAEGN